MMTVHPGRILKRELEARSPVRQQAGACPAPAVRQDHGYPERQAGHFFRHGASYHTARASPATLERA